MPPARPLPADETAILARAAAFPRHLTLEDLRGDALRAVAHAEGLDFAAALFYDRVRRSPFHGRFINEVERADDADSLPAPGARITLVPGALHRSHPETGADGRRVIDVAARLGVPVEVVDLPDFAPADENAQRVLKYLSRRDSNLPTVLVSLSKGSLDVAHALSQPGATEGFRGVAAWVDLSGIPDGTREIGWLLVRPWWRWALRVVCLVNRFDFAAVREMAFATSASEDAHRPFTVRVVGVPLERHLSGRRARRAYRRLASLGPSDGGGVLLADVAASKDVVYPVWGADHYLRPPWDVTDVVARVVQRALAAGTDTLTSTSLPTRSDTSRERA